MIACTFAGHRTILGDVVGQIKNEHTDYLIAMVWRDYGGAYNTLRYAQKINKQIILIER